MNILLIEDDPIWTMQLTNYLNQFGVVHHYSCFHKAKEKITSQFFDICFFDLHINSTQPLGLELIKLAYQLNFHCYALTSSEDVSHIEKAYQNGCRGFLSKNANPKEIFKALKNAIIRSQYDNNQNHFFKYFITHNELLKKQIKLVLRTPEIFDLNLFISGKTGTGKTFLVEQLCKTIFPDKKLININLAELPQNLLESELFGYKEGSFTGANKDYKGLLNEANKGILFLDEIGSLPLNTQVKLLKVLEEKRYKPIGSNEFIRCDFSLITATCDNVRKKILNGDFREDLFFRIAGHQIHIPSLEDRKEDIPFMVEHFRKESVKKLHLPDHVIEEITSKKWTGNIRELKNCIHKMIATHSFSIIKGQASKVQVKGSLEIPAWESIEDNGLGNTINEFENKVLQRYLKKYNNKVNIVCKKLKLSKTVFYRIKKQLDLSAEILINN